MPYAEKQRAWKATEVYLLVLNPFYFRFSSKPSYHFFPVFPGLRGKKAEHLGPTLIRLYTFLLPFFNCSLILFVAVHLFTASLNCFLEIKFHLLVQWVAPLISVISECLVIKNRYNTLCKV